MIRPFFLQSAILGMHSIQNHPMVVGGNIVARPMMYRLLLLTFIDSLMEERLFTSFNVSRI